MGTMRSDGGGAPYDVTTVPSHAPQSVCVELPQSPTTRRDNGDAGTDRTYSITTGTVIKQ